jgi:quinolinate synthase
VAKVLENLGHHSIQNHSHAISVDATIIDRARLPIDRMLAFTAAIKAGQLPGSLVPHFGAA